jgi:hypothetical protein
MRSHSRLILRTMLVAAGVALVAFAGFALAADEGKKPAAAPDISEWKLSGSRIIGCCCATPCPCRVNLKPMHEHGCDFTTAVHIEKGKLGKTKVDGIDWIYTGRGFSADQGTNWGYIYVSDKATDEQMAALGAFFTASAAGLGEKAPFIIGNFKGLRKAPVSYVRSKDGMAHSAEVTGILDIETKAIVLPGHKEPARLSGIFDDFGDSFVQAECIKHTLDDPATGYKWDLTKRQANFADFEISNATVAQGGIGWGCWSAHADLGSTDEYQEKNIGHDKW